MNLLISQFLKKNWLIISSLVVIFLIGFSIRVFNLWDNVIFAYDQARDAQRIVEIITKGDLKLVGPETDIPGVFNSPLLYYLLAPVYLIFNFNVNFAALFFILLDLSMVFVLYYVSVLLFEKKSVGILACLMWVFSYEFFAFSKLISNASLMVIGSIIFFTGLSLFIFRKKNIGLTISVVGLAISAGSNIYLGYLIFFYPIFFLYYKLKISLKTFVLNSLLLILLLSTFLISELKWNFQGFKALLYYTSGQDLVIISQNFFNYFQKLSELLYFSFFSFNNFLALSIFIILVLVAVKMEKKRPELIFLLAWVFSTFPLFAFSSGVLNVHVGQTTIFGAVTLLFALGINHILNNKTYRFLGLLLLLAIILGNLNLMAKDNFKATSMLGGDQFLLKDEKAVIDYTYRQAKGDKFSVCAVTAPLYVNTLWGYIYYSHGKQSFGYLPFWSGQKQTLNEGLLAQADKKYDTRFLIIQSDAPEYAVRATVFLEDEISNVIETQKIGGTIVQKRQRKKEGEKFVDSQGLTARETEGVLKDIAKNPRFFCDVIESGN
ncbi:MAG: hypothetical protein HY344_00040 [Candidatus Levybacteria bacterium]|nr:hypothetical protein [Candidatus Levybacteria bacterium]